MITFLICLAALITAYFTYGKYLERVCDIDDKHRVPSSTLFDGVDYIPLPKWKTFLIQLLNIAGLGPIFGAVLGAAFGPVAFLWITLGGIFMGAMHDFVSGVISVKSNGLSLPEIIGKYLGNNTRNAMRVFSVFLMVLVGAVFMSQPAELIAGKFPIEGLDTQAFGITSWNVFIWLVIILIYYIIATLLPIDKIIGKFYPVFGSALIIMALSILGVLIFDSGTYHIPELTSLRNYLPDAEHMPIMPMLFTTIACGAISGFHATQSPLMARCISSEKQCRFVFFGAMISESIIALIWAAIAMAFWGGVDGLNGAIAEHGGKAAILIDIIANTTMGRFVASFVVFGVVACAITSGDTAFRSARLIVADMLGVEQKSLHKRIWISLPLFIAGLLIIFTLPFGAIWSYFAWANQTLAMVTLWCITVYLAINGKQMIIGLLPALIMTLVCTSYIFISPLMFGMENRLVAYSLGGLLTLIIFASAIMKINATRNSLAKQMAQKL